MEPFTQRTSIAIPLDRTNVNTDEIIPARFLKTIKRNGFEDALFADWRFERDGKTPKPEFVLNQPRYQGGSILLAGDNFGCGSSREHAPWALYDYGIRCVIAPSFADIFYNNSFNSGILPVVLPEAVVQELMKEAEQHEGYQLTVDLARQTVTTPEGREFHFEIDAFKKESLYEGLDSIGWTLSHDEDITRYETQRKQDAPWLFAAHPAR